MAFEDGKVYKISCIADETVLDLADGSTANSAEIITWSFNGENNQLWLASKADAGWELSSLVQVKEEVVPEAKPSDVNNENTDDTGTGAVMATEVSNAPQAPKETKCLDQDMKKGRLLHYTRKDGFNFNQQWFTKAVTDGVSIYTICNVSSNKCITSHGSGKKVTCEKEERKKANQQWLILPMEK